MTIDLESLKRRCAKIDPDTDKIFAIPINEVRELLALYEKLEPCNTFVTAVVNQSLGYYTAEEIRNEAVKLVGHT